MTFKNVFKYFKYFFNNNKGIIWTDEYLYINKEIFHKQLMIYKYTRKFEQVANHYTDILSHYVRNANNKKMITHPASEEVTPGFLLRPEGPGWSASQVDSLGTPTNAGSSTSLLSKSSPDSVSSWKK